MSVADRIIVPLDVPTTAEAITLLDQLPQVTFWKVGLELFVSCGSEIFKILKQRQKRIFLDLKFNDIPSTIAGACRSAQHYGVDVLTIHATVGGRALEAAAEANQAEAEASGQPRPKLIAITLLTSLNSPELAFELKIPLELPDYVVQMALLAKEAGLDGAVCSPREIDQLRQICGDDFLLFCPGVRPTKQEAKDQRRVMTPAETLKVGADYLVIGRPITAAADPPLAWEQICEELAAI